jgi:PIN domain nuclease of toxin-antitoxin system
MSALLLVDTHVLYRWRVEPEKLTRPQLRALRNAERRSAIVSVSSITLWELALLAERGRIERKIPLDVWLAELVSQPLIEVLPITPEIAAKGAQLGSKFHNDPADRIIVATARCHRLKLLTSDERIRDWGGVSVI